MALDKAVSSGNIVRWGTVKQHNFLFKSLANNQYCSWEYTFLKDYLQWFKNKPSSQFTVFLILNFVGAFSLSIQISCQKNCFIQVIWCVI